MFSDAIKSHVVADHSSVCLLIPVLGKQRQEDLCVLEASLFYMQILRPARATLWPLSLSKKGSRYECSLFDRVIV